jgi:hypothetical protein
VAHDKARTLPELPAEQAYRRAFEEWEGSEDQALWNTTIADGLDE